MMVRPARAGDAEAIRAIRNRAIEETAALWTTTPQSADEAAAWLGAHLARRSAFVAEAAGEVVGFALYEPWRSYEGYRHTVGDSVYVRPDAHARGIGSALLAAVIDAARQAGHRVVIADIEAGNAASIRLHERFGFQRIGTVNEAGTKFGRWLDLTIMQLNLASKRPQRTYEADSTSGVNT